MPQDVTIKDIDSTRNANVVRNNDLSRNELATSSSLISKDGISIGLKNGLPFTFADSAAIDAFNRLRVSNPQTLFDSKNIFDDPDLASSVENAPLFYDNQETSGTGTSTLYDANKSEQVLIVSDFNCWYKSQTNKDEI
jgi:hypothetical protein